MPTQIQEKIYRLIETFDTVIIHRHTRPDPDALGSQHGLAAVIRETFPEKTVHTPGEVPEGLQWMAQPSTLEKDRYTDALVIILDTAEQDRIDGEHALRGEETVDIDHHPGSEDFADRQWVDPDASSTAEMLTVLVEETALQLNTDAATSLYTGIATDTGRFRHDNVTTATHKAAATLLQYDIPTQEIFDNLSSRTLADARFDGYVLSNLKQSSGGVVYTYISQEDMEHHDVTAEEASNALYAFSNLDDVPAWVLFLEKENGEIRVRLRSDYPVANTVAEMYGGGGHDKASGATLEDAAEIQDVIDTFDTVLNEYREEHQ